MNKGEPGIARTCAYKSARDYTHSTVKKKVTCSLATR